MKAEKVSTKSIYKDLTNIEVKYGAKILKSMCAAIIFKIMWWNWPEARDGFIEELKELKSEKAKGKKE